jgi:hypothetical protein
MMATERRTSPRVSAYLPVRLHPNHQLRVVETLTKNIGQGGTRCVSPTVFPVSTELTVEVSLSPGQEPMVLRGRTAWFRTIPESEQYDVGIAFVDPTSKNKQRLSTYIDRSKS